MSSVLEMSRSSSSSSGDIVARDPFEAIARSPALKLRLHEWKKEEEVVNQRIERKEQRLNNTKNESYQLLGIFFVYQGVILTALAQATHLHRGNAWIPFVLSLLASVSTIFALWYKLGDCANLMAQVEDEKKYARALYRASDNLKNMGASFRYSLDCEPQIPQSRLKQDKGFVRLIWDGHMQVYGASIVGILILFSIIMGVACFVVLHGCQCST